MPQPIARMYASQGAASAAVDELQASGISAETFHKVVHPAGHDATEDAPVVETTAPSLDAITTAGVPPEHVKIYAEGIDRGEALVVAYPNFGFGQAATDILESHGPVEVALPDVAPAKVVSRGWDWHSATPLSDWLGWRVLLDDPTPLSNYLKRPVLKPEPASSATLDRIRRESGDAAPLSNKIGMPLLSDNPAPLSTRFGWRLLWDKAAPLSEKIGRKTLLDDPAPLSAKLGWRVLLDNPTPLSTALGLRTVSKK